MAFEIRENVFDHKWISQGQLQRWVSAAVVVRVEERGGCSEQGVENAVHRVIDSLNVSYPAVMIDREVGDMAGGATNLVEYSAPVVSGAVLHVMPRFKVVEEVELQVIHNGGIHLIPVLRIGSRRRTDLIL